MSVSNVVLRFSLNRNNVVARATAAGLAQHTAEADIAIAAFHKDVSCGEAEANLVISLEQRTLDLRLEKWRRPGPQNIICDQNLFPTLGSAFP